MNDIMLIKECKEFKVKHIPSIITEKSLYIYFCIVPPAFDGNFELQN